MPEMFSKVNGTTYRLANEPPIPWNILKPKDHLTILDDANGKRTGGQHKDPNAFIVVHTATNIRLGYVPKDTAKSLRDQDTQLFNCHITEITGGGDLNYGINILIRYE